jgi:hypothetical protein
MSSNISIAIGGKKELIESLVNTTKTCIQNDLNITHVGKNFFSEFQLVEVEVDFWVFGYSTINFEFEYEAMTILGYLLAEANKIKVSYQIYQVLNGSGKSIEKNNRAVLGNKFDQRVPNLFTTPVICSSCFADPGLKLDAFNMGIDNADICPNCENTDGKKLTEELIEKLVHRYFVKGTTFKEKYGGAPTIQFNNYHYKKSQIIVPDHLKKDMELIEEKLKIGFFYYGPPLWMVGENEVLKSLQKKHKSHKIINDIVDKYPAKILSTASKFFRLRINPNNPLNDSEYDSNPTPGKNRLDSKNLPILYASQDIEICIHECRVTVEDDTYIATLAPTRDLNLLDLTVILQENVNDFESVDMAIHMLFLAGKHSYRISRAIALCANKSGFDGIIYPSYFSWIRTGTMRLETVYGLSIRQINSLLKHAKSQIIENIALFGNPITEGKIMVIGKNKLLLNKVKYDYHFGPGKYM